MRLLLDECVDARMADHLRAAGHDVATVQALDPSAHVRSVLALATGQSRTLVATDLDLGEPLVRTKLRSRGVILLRLEGVQPQDAAVRLNAALAAHGRGLTGPLLVVDRRRDRLRNLPPPP